MKPSKTQLNLWIILGNFLWVMSIILGIYLNFDETKAFHALEASGFENIEVQGFRFFGCGDGDAYRRGFKAEMNGKTVTGSACAGYFKGTTIRVD
jgi:hypothetical protein